MTLNEHRLLGLLGRRMEESRLGLAPLGGMTYDQHAAANGLEREPYRSAADLSRRRAEARRQRVAT
jgi:hypothetical protein